MNGATAANKLPCGKCTEQQAPSAQDVPEPTAIDMPKISAASQQRQYLPISQNTSA
jgi:hypothetical protein